MEQSRRMDEKITYRMEQREQKLTGVLWNLYVLLLMQAGIGGYLVCWVQLQQTEIVLLMLAVVLSCLVCVCFSYIHRGEAAGGVFLGAAALLIILFRGVSSVFYGFFGFLNYLLGWWNQKKEDGIPLLYTGRISREDILAFTILLVLFFTFVSWQLIRHSNLTGIFLLLLAFAVTGFLIDRYTALGLSALLSGWLGCWLAEIRKKPSIRRLCWILGISTELFVVAGWVAGEPVDVMLHLKEAVVSGINDLRYGSDTLPQGDLSKADGLLDGNDETLRVTMKKGKDMYLRGFVGGRYRNGVWEPLPEASYKGDNSGMLDWLKEAGFIPQNQYASYVQNDKKRLMQENETQQIGIEVTGANRSYLYVPYSADGIPDTDGKTMQDGSYTAAGFFGKRDYSYTEISTDRPGELLHAESWILSPETDRQRQYVQAENIYADFVYQNYLETGDTMTQMIRAVFYPDAEWSDNSHTIYEVTQQIRSVLEERIAYREKPDAVPGGVEPISWFLNKGRQGNSVLYASAAVEAFRVQGIPARYVEGYLIRNTYDPDVTVTLTSQDSHAWAEVYLDGVGWIPIDVTPGFYYDTYTLHQMVQMPQNVNQTAAEEDSSESGNEIDNEADGSEQGKTEQKDNKILVIPLFILAYLVLAAAVLITIQEACYFISVLIIEKRYRRLTAEERVGFLEQEIYTLLCLYGYPAEPGWKTDWIDGQLTERFTVFTAGAYIRVSGIMEKHIYGQQTPAAYEIRVMENFVQKLYDVRSQTDRKTRRRIRWKMIKNAFH